VDLDRPAGDVNDAQHVHVGQADEQLARTRRVAPTGAPQGSVGVGTTDSVEPL
jgi:thiamine monophosphate synthase